MTLDQKTRWAYSTMLPSPHGAQKVENLIYKMHTNELNGHY